MHELLGRESRACPPSTIPSSHRQNNPSLPSSSFPIFYNHPPSTATKASFTDSSPGTPLLSVFHLLRHPISLLHSAPPTYTVRLVSERQLARSPWQADLPPGSHSRTPSNLPIHLQSHHQDTANNPTRNLYRTPSQKRPRDPRFFGATIEDAGKASPGIASRQKSEQWRALSRSAQAPHPAAHVHSLLHMTPVCVHMPQSGPAATPPPSLPSAFPASTRDRWRPRAIPRWPGPSPW